MEIFLFRHFATAGNLEKRYIGSTDEVILPVKERKKVPEVEIVFVSPMRRCRETADLLYPLVRKVACEAFRECDFGDFEGQNYRELTGNPAYQAWIDSGGTLPFPGGESMESFCRRTRKAFEQVMEELLERKIQKAAIVAHGGTVMALLSEYAVPEKSYYEWKCGNGCGYRIHISEELWKTGKKECKVEEKL